MHVTGYIVKGLKENTPSGGRIVVVFIFQFLLFCFTNSQCVSFEIGTPKMLSWPHGLSFNRLGIETVTWTFWVVTTLLASDQFKIFVA